MFRAAPMLPQSRLMLEAATLPSKLSRHFRSSFELSSETGLLRRMLVKWRRGHFAL